MAVGIDVVSISRIEKLMQNERFLKRCFSEREREYFLLRRNSPQSVAANFAGKEAFLKAAKTGLGGAKLCEIEILRESSGAPVIELSGGALELARSLRLEETEVSLTHDGGIAAAIVQIVTAK